MLSMQAETAATAAIEDMLGGKDIQHDEPTPLVGSREANFNRGLKVNNLGGFTCNNS